MNPAAYLTAQLEPRVCSDQINSIFTIRKISFQDEISIHTVTLLKGGPPF